MHAYVALSPAPLKVHTACVGWCILWLSNKLCTSFCTVHSVHSFVSRPSDASVCRLQY